MFAMSDVTRKSTRKIQLGVCHRRYALQQADTERRPPTLRTRAAAAAAAATGLPYRTLRRDFVSLPLLILPPTFCFHYFVVIKVYFFLRLRPNSKKVEDLSCQLTYQDMSLFSSVLSGWSSGLKARPPDATSRPSGNEGIGQGVAASGGSSVEAGGFTDEEGYDVDDNDDDVEDDAEVQRGGYTGTAAFFFFWSPVLPRALLDACLPPLPAPRLARHGLLSGMFVLRFVRILYFCSRRSELKRSTPLSVVHLGVTLCRGCQPCACVVVRFGRVVGEPCFLS